ncbi:hypothetical protein ACFQ0B_00800 [Nonomuraea thailandensis]
MAISRCSLAVAWTRSYAPMRSIPVTRAVTPGEAPAGVMRTNSGRTPMRTGPGGSGSLTVPTSSRPTRTTSPAISAGSMFIPGEPMKWPTNSCDGDRNSSDGSPACTIAPSLSTTTSSANVSASVWSWVT